MNLLEENIKNYKEKNKELSSLRKEILKSIFIQYPNIKEIGLEETEEYDDNNYYKALNLYSINDVVFEESFRDEYYFEEYLSSEEGKSFLVENNLKEADLNLIVSIIFSLDSASVVYFCDDNNYLSLKSIEAKVTY